MFTGIIEEIGRVSALPAKGTGGRIRIDASCVLEGTKLGDSIAVNGVCLTVVELGSHSFSADVMPETLSRSSLGELFAGSAVKLERAMPADGRFGGHIVSGHIDGTGRISSIVADGNAVRYRIRCASELLAYIVEKGSIAIDGTSLTVSELFADGFEVSVIPHTVDNTNLNTKREGSLLNLECDIVGKYVESLLQPRSNAAQADTGSLTLQQLSELGF